MPDLIQDAPGKHLRVQGGGNALESFYLWPDYPATSLVVFLVGTMTFFYFAREPLQRALHALGEGGAGGLLKLAAWTEGVAERLHEKNRKVLLEAGLAQAGHKVQQEFRRLESSYTKRLAEYPELHLKLDGNVTKIDADYKECRSVPPDVPGWREVVESLAKIQEMARDRMIEKMLKQIHKSAEASEKKALEEYRTQTAKRHKILGGMAPSWQKIEKLMQQMQRSVSSVLDTTRKLDKYMKEFEELGSRGAESVDLLAAKATKLFIFSVIVIGVAVGGAFINFQLIALPMSELVPAGARILGMPVSQVAALVIVTLETVVGIFLMEALGITNIFPQIEAMSKGNRRIILFATLAGLFFLASVEASLAILREHLVESEMTLRQSLAGAAAPADAQSSMIPVIGQATLGFVLPWVLAMVAVPLEMLIESGQHVGVKLAAALVQLFGHASRILAHVLEFLIRIVTHLYDAYVVIPGQVAAALQRRSAAAGAVSSGAGASRSRRAS